MRVRTSFTIEGSDSEFVKFTVPPLKALLKVCSPSASGNKQELAAHAVGYQKVHFFLFTVTIFWSAKKPNKNDAEMLFSILHHLSPVILVNATAVAFALLHSSTFRFSFCCCTQREPMPRQKSARKWHL